MTIQPKVYVAKFCIRYHMFSKILLINQCAMYQ